MFVAVSSCLMGNPVRYDGKSKANAYVMEQLAKHCEFLTLCPEHVAFGTPRQTIHVQHNLDNAVQPLSVVENEQKADVTAELLSAIDTQIVAMREANVCGVILKSKSPSCGYGSTPVFVNGLQANVANGLFTEAILANYPYLPMIEETDLNDEWHRELFLTEMFVYQEILAISLEKTSFEKLCAFHQKHQHLLALKNPQLMTKMKDLLAELLIEYHPQSVANYLLRAQQALATKAYIDDFVAVFKQLLSELPKPSQTDLQEAITAFQMKQLSYATIAGLFRTQLEANGQSDYLETSILNPYLDDLATRTY